MPSLPKDRPAGRLGRLISALRPARTGPLPVQTGFPTSLADLFVKNHGRLKKQGPSSNRRKRRGAPALPSSPEPSPPAPSPPPSPPPAAVSPPSAQPRPGLPLAEPVCRPGGGAAGLGLGFLALVGVASLALLVIWSRKVVAAVTVAAFSLFLLESVRPSSLRRRPRPPALDIDGRGYVSPIREAELDPEPPGSSFSDSGRGISASILGIEEAGEDSCRWEAKPRKRSPWRKLIPRKLQSGRRIGKESGSLSLSSSFRSEVSVADSTLGGNGNGNGNANATRGATDPADSRRGRGSQAANAVVGRSPDSSGPLRGIMGDGDGAVIRSPDSSGPLRGIMGAEACCAPTETDEPAGVNGVGGGGRFPLVAVILVVLVGLVAGRLPAVALTVLWAVLVGRLQTRSRRDGDRSV